MDDPPAHHRDCSKIPGSRALGAIHELDSVPYRGTWYLGSSSTIRRAAHMHTDILQHQVEEDTDGYGCEGEEEQGGEARLRAHRTGIFHSFVYTQNYFKPFFTSDT